MDTGSAHMSSSRRLLGRAVKVLGLEKYETELRSSLEVEDFETFLCLNEDDLCQLNMPRPKRQRVLSYISEKLNPTGRRSITTEEADSAPEPKPTADPSPECPPPCPPPALLDGSPPKPSTSTQKENLPPAMPTPCNGKRPISAIDDVPAGSPASASVQKRPAKKVMTMQIHSPSLQKPMTLQYSVGNRDVDLGHTKSRLSQVIENHIGIPENEQLLYLRSGRRVDGSKAICGAVVVDVSEDTEENPATSPGEEQADPASQPLIVYTKQHVNEAKSSKIALTVRDLNCVDTPVVWELPLGSSLVDLQQRVQKHFGPRRVAQMLYFNLTRVDKPPAILAQTTLFDLAELLHVPVPVPSGKSFAGECMVVTDAVLVRWGAGLVVKMESSVPSIEKFEMHVNPEAPVVALKILIENKYSLPVARQRLFLLSQSDSFRQPLSNMQKLQEFALDSNSVIFMEMLTAARLPPLPPSPERPPAESAPVDPMPSTPAEPQDSKAKKAKAKARRRRR